MFQKANQYLRNGQYEEAITAYIKLIKVNPEFYIYHQNLSQAYAYLGKEKESVTVFEQAKNLRRQQQAIISSINDSCNHPIFSAS